MENCDSILSLNFSDKTGEEYKKSPCKVYKKIIKII